MRNKTMALCAFGSLFCLMAQAQWKMQPTPNDTLQSVRQLKNGDVVLSIYAPEASGGHTWHTWRNDLYNLAQQLFK